MEIKMINLGVYYEHLKKEIETLLIQEKSEKDPYKRWNLSEQVKLVNKLLADYDTLIMNQ